MKDKFFLDTNILIYTFDSRVPNKQETARRLVAKALSTSNGIISYQVVQEFLNVASRKFAKPLSPEDCKKYLDVVLTPLCKVFPSIDLYNRTIEWSDRLKYSFYDSLIISSALEVGCRTLYSEDLQNQQVIDNLTIVNPFV